MEAALGAQPWLAGPDLTLADLNMAPFILRLAGFEEHDLPRDWPHVAAWLEALRARPSFAAAGMVEQPRGPAPPPPR